MDRTYGELYYKDLTNYPPQQLAVITKIKTFLASLIFTEDVLIDALEKFIVADIINATSDGGIKEATESFKRTNQRYPFIGYSYDIVELSEEKKVYRALNGNYYDYDLDCKVDAKPVKSLMPMILFTNNPQDYYTALKIINSRADSLIKLDVPILINGLAKFFTIQMRMTVEKGNYASNFEEYMRTNDIWDININAEIEYHDYVIDTDVQPIDDVEMYLKTKDEYDLDSSPTDTSLTAPDTPILSSSTPVDNSTGIAVDTDIVLTFNVGMSEDSVMDSISVDPYFDALYTWGEDSLILTISPYTDLDSLTEYTITITDNAFSWWNEENIEEDIIISFTTV